MTSRELVKRALDFEITERIPLECPYNIGIENDVSGPSYHYGLGKTQGKTYIKGSSIDAWGCVWVAAEDGVAGEVKEPPIESWSDLSSFRPPFDVLDEADLSDVNRQCGATDKFMMRQWGTNPFERMQFLRGSENLFIDLAEMRSELYKLRDMVHEFHLREVEMWADTDVDGIHIADDWGTQRSLLISPKLWREFFKPIYKDYCDIAHSRGKYVMMHSDGYTEDIIPDLIEIGVNAVNTQIDCMDVQKLSELYHGKIAFWGGFDRQYLLPFGDESEVRAEVNRFAGELLKYGRTGVVAQCFRDKGGRESNIRAYYEAWRNI